jgi:hypothetical protein
MTFYATSTHVPETRDQRASTRLDWFGAGVTVIGLGGVTFGLIQGPGSGWSSKLVLLSLIVGSAALASFPFIELRTPNPMVPLQLFLSSNFTGSNLATLGVYFSFSGFFLFLVLKLQQVQGYTPIEAGASLLPVTLLLLLLSPRVGGLIARLGARILMGTGAAIVALAFFLMALMGRDPSYWTQILPAVIVLALGMCLFITPLTATVMGAVPPDSVGVASGVNNAVSRIAALLAIAVLGVLVVTQFQSALTARLGATGIASGPRAALISNATRLADDPIPKGMTRAQRQAVESAIKDSYVVAFRWAMGTCALLCLLSSFVSFAMIRPEAAVAPAGGEAIAGTAAG